MKKIILGVCGCVEAYKAAPLAAQLTQKGGDVHVIMTHNSTRFIAPLTFEAVTKNRCISDTYQRKEYDRDHQPLTTAVDAFVVAPASANMLAKLAHGLADDMLSTTMLSCRCLKVVAPCMNAVMYADPAVQHNLTVLKERGFKVIPAGPDGSMPGEELIRDYVLNELGQE